MSSTASVTLWLGRLKTGDLDAVQRLFDRYFSKLVQLSHGKLHGGVWGLADEEDVALSAFNSFCQRARAGQFAQLNDRNNLWAVLAVIAARKARALTEHEKRLKRGGKASAVDVPLEELIAAEPTPDDVAILAEEVRNLFDVLNKEGDETLVRIAQWKMEGCTETEIAAKLGCVTRTVQRKLELIRRLVEKQDHA